MACVIRERLRANRRYKTAPWGTRNRRGRPPKVKIRIKTKTAESQEQPFAPDSAGSFDNHSITGRNE